ncbi:MULTISPECIES: hypothetical protein [Pseudoalteromonas]|uniref:Uncharacterized protein n=1 Tax=Pseudoalteromonas piscicida TaxID=43662 RepID=A0AAD0RKE2_PSEO7|nr:MULTISPECIES: hypothetical protein [Pseudoalteromonas]ASD68509.1 hypothetical protein B1L02_16795 [Pseudoalteromonas piscicida]AXR03564.1 hypothetical protein D0511_16865 [Pseudoalteromonas piscicida]PHI36326.1 hypothetical protein CBQ28_15070 [Pseudoalteromonas sp. GCY]QQQ66913.1 hypothetical protein JJQ94_22125 [Pseudoalteromonas sp. GCY]
MQHRVRLIKDKIEQAQRLPALKAGKKIELAESVLDETVSLLYEMVSRIEILEAHYGEIE